MYWITSDGAKSVDRLLDLPNPAASLQFKVLGNAATRELLQYQVSEQNRYYMEGWATAQLILGFFFFFFLLFGTREDKFSLLLAFLMVVGVAAQRFFLVPEMNALGKTVDFVSPEAYVPGRRGLPIVQSAYNTVEIAKLGLGVVLTIWLVVGTRSRRSRSEARQQLDLINKANYRHVDR